MWLNNFFLLGCEDIFPVMLFFFLSIFINHIIWNEAITLNNWTDSFFHCIIYRATVSSIWTIYDGKLINIVSKLKDPLCQSRNISWEIAIFVSIFFVCQTSIFIVYTKKSEIKVLYLSEIIKYILCRTN